MLSIEEQIKAWVDYNGEGSRPITATEARERAAATRAVDLTASKAGLLKLQALVAAAVILVVVAAAALVYVNQKDGHDLVASSPVDLNIFRAVNWTQAADIAPIDYVDFHFGFESGQLTTENLTIALQLAMRGSLDGEASTEGTDPNLWLSEFGIDPLDITAAIRWGFPPEETWVLSGDFSAENLDATIHNNTDWVDLLETAEHRGVTYYSWGEDFAQYDRPSILGSFGHRVALVDGLFVATRSTESLKGTIDQILDAPTESDSLDQAREVLNHLRQHSRWSAAITLNEAPGEADTYPAIALAPLNWWEAQVSAAHIVIVSATETQAIELKEQLEAKLTDLEDNASKLSNNEWSVDQARNSRVISLRIDFDDSMNSLQRSELMTNLLVALDPNSG
ncbi:MAG: hypothetical protein WC184_07160 [Acidimicrobiia bacterium]